MIVGVVLQILQRQVLQLALQLIETQLVGQGRIEVGGFFRHPFLGFRLVGVANLSHQVHTTGNHDEDDAHVLGKRQQQVAEVLALHHGVLLVELLNALQTVEYATHGNAIGGSHIVDSQESRLYAGVQQDGQHGIAAQSYLVNHE